LGLSAAYSVAAVLSATAEIRRRDGSCIRIGSREGVDR
jgi:hypothetical protein